MTVLLLGATGYVGSAFRQLLDQQSIEYRSPSHRDSNFADQHSLASLVRDTRPSFLINAAGFTGRPNVDACEKHKSECLEGNAVLPGVLREVCEVFNVPWGHVSSGCIYSGTRPDGTGFQESDQPNFCFRTNNCSFYSGCKALGEECLLGADNVFVWRCRIPFNEVDSPRNYLSKLMQYECLVNCENSLSHLNEFVSACWQTWVRRVPFGTYNMTNPGSTNARNVVEIIKRELKLTKEFKFFRDEEEFHRLAVTTPRSSCVLDVSKLLSTGIVLSHVTDAVTMSLRNWQRQVELTS